MAVHPLQEWAKLWPPGDLESQEPPTVGDGLSRGRRGPTPPSNGGEQPSSDSSDDSRGTESVEDEPAKVAKSAVDQLFDRHKSFSGQYMQTTPPKSLHACRIVIERKMRKGVFAGRMEFLAQLLENGRQYSSGYSYNVTIYSEKDNEEITIDAKGLSNPRGRNVYSDEFRIAAKIDGLGFQGKNIQMKAD